MYKNLLLDKLTNNKLTLDDFDIRDDFTNYIIKQMNESLHTIGKGGVGKVYFIDNTFVVKKSAPCIAEEKSKLYQYCTDIRKLKKNFVKTIPGGNNKTNYILPNLLSEILVGTMLGENIHFSNTITSMIVEEDDKPDVYIVMNQYNTISDMNLTETHIFYLLYQVAYTLMNAQKQYYLTHYDLHIDNLLSSAWPDNINSITYGKITINREDCPFIIKISDFALTRLETDKVIITPEQTTLHKINTFGEFNPSYDFMCLLGSMLIDYKLSASVKQHITLDVKKELYALLVWYLNDDIDMTLPLQDIHNHICDTYFFYLKNIGFTFRPKTKGNYLPYLNTKSMFEVVEYLQKKITYTKTPGDLYIDDLSPYWTNTKILLYNPSLPLNAKPLKNQSIVKYASMVVDDFITVSKYHLLYNKLPNKNNLTLEKKQIKHCPIQEHYITTMYVKKNHTQQFMYDCCKIDAVKYLINNHKVGFIMNGGFFTCKNDFLPIGPYKDQYKYIDKNPIPEHYKDVYGYIVLKNNRLTIVKTYDGIDQVCTSGPILIYDGKIIFTSDNIKYSCGDKVKNADLFISQTSTSIKLKGHYEYENKNGKCNMKIIKNPQTYQRCDTITPGELQHANNPNPRGALCILNNNDYVFVCFEGRADKGDGVDLESMGEALLASYPNIKHAINLDGGVSANLVFRTREKQSIVYISNPARYKYYPAGNIIGLFA